VAVIVAGLAIVVATLGVEATRMGMHLLGRESDAS
jgi:hypothetical protein